jgi:8-oxo-dGTP pyrophosphatase MutT (NUDIX family)
MPDLRAQLRRALDRPLAPPPAPRRAAVAAILTPSDDLLFIHRAERAGDPWSGHVSLPGGRVDPGDEGPLAAAIRETREEIGLVLHVGQLIGPLTPIAPIATATDLAIYPFLFALDHEPEPVPNEEVQAVYRVGLARLLSDEGRGPMDWSWRGQPLTLPAVAFPGQLRLWGLTLRVVDELLDHVDGRGLGLDRLRR